MHMNFSAVEGHVRGLLGPTTDMNLSRTWLKSLSVLPVLACLMWGLYSGVTHESPTVVTFNAEAITRQFVMQLSQYKLSDENLRKKTEAFKKAQLDALNEYAAKHHALVMQRNHVIAGAQDVTPEIEKLIAIHMRTAS